MTGQTPPRTAAFTATVRVHLLHAPDPDTEPNPDLEAAAIREGVVFALPPHKGDTFIPGQLSQLADLLLRIVARARDRLD